ncbi:hypothetical protein [Candidatus Weimeria sp. HCP3S3_B5]|uniref:hypothetical protein n=1 Tax=Candidatus Weimeria sp. HCP3S3_B5 TaxID=3438871 RepID=UPI003F8B2BC6
MKKGLAIVLAAATALTFAPVSTLGLQGVVEAQAATVQATNASAKVTLDGTNDAALSATTATVKAGGSLTLTFENSSASAIDKATITAKKGGTAQDTGLTVKQDGAALTGASDVFTLNSIAAKAGDKNGATTVVISFAGNATTGTDYTFEINYDSHTAKTLTVNYTNTADAQAAQDHLDDASKAIFQGVDDTVYLRNTNDFSMDLKPSVITAGGKSYNGSDLYYQQVSDATVGGSLTAPTTTTLTHATYTSEVQGTNTKINFKAEKGKLTLARKSSASSDDFVAGKFILAAYTANTDNTDYTLVGYKTVNVKLAQNETYTLGLKASSYTMSLGTVDKTDALEVESVGKADGTKLSDSTNPTLNSFKTAEAANWTVSGRGIVTVAADADVASITSDDVIAVYSTATKTFFAKHAGTTEATITVSNKSQIAQTKVPLTVLGTSQYALKATADGTADSAEIGESDTNPVILDVKSVNSYDLAKHLYKSEGMTLSYESSNTKNTVSDAGVVKATTVTDSFYVTVTGKINGNIVKQLRVYFKVNALPYDVPAVTGVDKDQADVLNGVDYASVVRAGIPTEEGLAASQIKYVQIDVTGTEPTNVTEALNIVSTSGAIVTASLAGQRGSAVTGVSSNGVVTLAPNATTGVAAIKLVSTATSTTALSTNYVFVVVDKKDPEIKAADAYKIGTVAGAEDNKSFESDINFNDIIAKSGVTVRALVKGDDLHAAKTLYSYAPTQAVNDANFSNEVAGSTFKGVHVARVQGKVENLLISYNAGAGTAYKVVRIDSVAGVRNSVTKIENVTTGKVVYDSAKDSAVAVPELRLDGNTTLKVTLAYAIDKNDTHANITSTSLYNGSDPLNQNIMTATRDEKKADGFTTFYLYPTTQGTQVVTFKPSGDISATDHSIVDNDNKQLSITYRESLTLSKVTGLKVANKKGAAVSVSWKSQGANVLYRVYKKVGSGKWVAKNVAGTKTSLKVKKGAKVTVKVKAYKKTDAGKTVWGPKATKVTKKTDKK